MPTNKSYKKIFSLVKRVLRNELDLKQATELLSCDSFKSHLKEEIIIALDEAAKELVVRSPKAAYVFAELSYEASKIKDDPRLQADCGFTLGVVFSYLGRYLDSIPLFQQALTFFQGERENQAVGFALGNLGAAYSSLGDYSSAIDYYQQALKISRESGDRHGEGVSLGNLGSAYFCLGNYSKAIESLKPALRISRELGDQKGEGDRRGNLGSVYSSLGDYCKAIECHQSALRIYRHIGDRKGEASRLGNLGIVYFDLGDFPSAIKHQRQALELSRKIGDRQGEASFFGSLGNIYSSLGDYSRAIEYIHSALQISREIGDQKGEGIHAGNLSIVHGLLGDYRRALEHSWQALRIHQKIGDREAAGKTFSNLGNACFNLGNYTRALDYHQQALEVSCEIGHRQLEGASLANLGSTYSSLGDYVTAIDYHQRAMEIARELGDRKGEQQRIGNLGVTYQLLRDYPKAIECLQVALEMCKKTGTTYLEAILLANLGKAHDQGLKEDDIAYYHYRRSIELTERMRASIKEEGQRSSFSGKSEDVYDLMILLCNRMKGEQKEKSEESFEYLERSKSRTFLESLAHTRLISRAEIPPELIKRENELLREIRVLYSMRGKQPSVPLAEIEKLESELDEVWSEMEGIDPEYVSMRRGKPLSLSQIQQLVRSQRKKTCLVEYFLSSDKFLTFILRSDETELQVEEADTPVEQFNYYGEKYFEELHYFGQRNVGQTWQNLSKYLIDPILKYLDGIETIYFIPHRQLHYLPLHALKHSGKYLIEKYKIVYSPSASVISYCQKKRRDKRKSCLSLGVVFEEEADRVASIFGDSSLIYKGSHVTKDLVRKQAKDKDVIHFSCHGFFDQQIPMRSGLILGNHEVLAVEDVFQLELDADLVTLSACQTGANEQKPGDDLVGLTRSFIYAGTPSVVVSLWSVRANSTIELMEKFYTYLKQGKTKVEALQKAQLDIMNNAEHPEWNHPYYWAPFVLVGDWK